MIALIAFTARLAAAEANAEEVLDEDGSVMGAADGASEAADEREVARHDHLTRIGRVDLTISWRRTVRVADMRGTLADGAVPDGTPAPHAIASPLDPVTTARGVLWILLTWSH